MSKILNGLPETKLTPTEEAELSRKIQKRRNTVAINKLVLHNMREAIPYATRCCRASLDEDEIFSLCYAALSKAAPNFKASTIRFFAYAKVYIRGELSRTWKRKDTVKSSSLHQTQLPQIVRRINVSERFEGELGTLYKEDIAPIEPDYVEPEFRLIDLKEKWKMVEPLLHSALDGRERTILKLYYESDFSLEQIGDMLVPSISREAVRIIHFLAMEKLRRALVRAHHLKI